MSRPPVRRSGPAVLVLLAVAALAMGPGLHSLQQIGAQLDQGILSASQAYAERFEAWSPSPFVVPLAAFAGGLLASVSPCVLAMLPLNLGYIGTP